jgi:hypothetical protein
LEHYARSSTGICGRPGRHFHLQNNFRPARCHRIMVFGRTTISTSRHSKHFARMAKLIRVAASIRRGSTPRSLNSPSCRRRNRFWAWTDRLGRNRRMGNRAASARRWTAILTSATTRSSSDSLAPKVAPKRLETISARIFAEHNGLSLPRRNRKAKTRKGDHAGHDFCCDSLSMLPTFQRKNCWYVALIHSRL